MPRPERQLITLFRRLSRRGAPSDEPVRGEIIQGLLHVPHAYAWPSWLKCLTATLTLWGRDSLVVRFKRQRARETVSCFMFTMDYSGAFQQHPQFGMAPVNVDSSLSVDMIRFYAEQAAMHSARNPGNQDAAMAAVQWQQRLMSAAQSSASAPGPMGPVHAQAMPMPGAHAGQLGASAPPLVHAPTPPLAAGGPVNDPRKWEN